jgi:hypothetical protein
MCFNILCSKSLGLSVSIKRRETRVSENISINIEQFDFVLRTKVLCYLLSKLMNMMSFTYNSCDDILSLKIIEIRKGSFKRDIQ